MDFTLEELKALSKRKDVQRVEIMQGTVCVFAESEEACRAILEERKRTEKIKAPQQSESKKDSLMFIFAVVLLLVIIQLSSLFGG